DSGLANDLHWQLRSDRIEIVTADFLTFDLSKFSGIKVIGNLPYSLSSQILLRLIDFSSSWQLAVLTTQREFAQRILARPGSKTYGAITVLCSVRVTAESLFNLPPKWFSPRPAVVSTAFRLKVREQPLFGCSDPDRFRRVVKAAFGQRRKTLLNSLSSGLGIDKNVISRVLLQQGVNLDARAETLTPEQFHLLSDALP
ncbi:MAG: rRNA adenine dimethyltransferase family protein, partial [candidate division WOR-3 bacterium]